MAIPEVAGSPSAVALATTFACGFNGIGTFLGPMLAGFLYDAHGDYVLGIDSKDPPVRVDS